jgi:predicted nucleic acid-binding protein
MESLTGRHIYLDANIIIYILEDYPPLRARITALLSMIGNGDIRCSTSDLTLTEVLPGPIRAGRPEIVKAYQAMLFDGEVVKLHGLSRGACLRAAELRVNAGMKTPDALHVGAALDLGCDVFLTNDTRIRPVAGLVIEQISG